nr:MAG TPA: hypothetical protein [Caudoviricetes sp.]
MDEIPRVKQLPVSLDRQWLTLAGQSARPQGFPVFYSTHMIFQPWPHSTVLNHVLQDMHIWLTVSSLAIRLDRGTGSIYLFLHGLYR